jgi:predicted ABC-type sugar transport system permease subunit
MAILGKQAQQSNVTDSNGLSDVLGGLMGGKQEDQNFILSFLDADGDGSVIDDVAGMVLGNNKKKGGIGGLLGKLFGN